MASNVLMCRWVEGWHEVKRQTSIDAIGRREAFLALGAISEVAEVERVGNLQLDVVANPRTAIAADLAAIDHTDAPYWAFNVGDTIVVPDYGTGTIAQRVRSITGAEDDNGEITYSPELGDLILEEQERTLQTVKKMADGTLEGESAVAQPPLRTQIQRMWTSPSPPAGGIGFTVASTSPRGYTTSSPLRGVPPGDGTYTLTKFWCRPETEGAHDGIEVQIELWQDVPGGDGSFAAAHVNIGQNFEPGVEYVGTIVDNTIVFQPEWGIHFVSYGDQTGDVYVAAEFEGGGTVIVVEWVPPTLRVVQT